MLSHDALRLDLEDFGRLLSALRAQLAAGRPVEAWQADAVRRFWRHALHMLVVHHDSEEGGFWRNPALCCLRFLRAGRPFFRRGGPAQLALLPQGNAAHPIQLPQPLITCAELYFPLMRQKFPVEEKQTSDHTEIVRQASGERNSVITDTAIVQVLV